jgi:hypothetical protein
MKSKKHRKVACPIEPAERRLSDSQAYWNLAADAYQEPDVFIRHTQATIQALRTVTWLLQKAKGELPGFEAWYKVRQDRMSADRVLKWLVEMRNHIEKRGDIEPSSSLRVGLYRDVRADEADEVDLPPCLEAPSAIGVFMKLLPPPSFRSESIIRVQREWRHTGLPDWEILDALGYAFGFLQQIMIEAHHLLEERGKNCASYRAVTSSNMRLPFRMTDRRFESALWFKPASQTFVRYGLRRKGFRREDMGRIKNRPKMEVPPLAKGLTPSEKCENLLSYGKRYLQRDGGIVPVFFIEGVDSLQPLMYQTDDRADHHAMARQVAELVRLERAVSVLHMLEIWTSAPEAINRGIQYAADDPARGEAVQVTCITAEEGACTCVTPFRRQNNTIVFEKTLHTAPSVPVKLSCIQRAFESRTSGKQRHP